MRPLRKALAATGALAALLIGMGGAPPTTAYWSDQVQATSGDWTAGSVPTPGPAACANAGGSVSLSWANVGSRFAYDITLHRVDTGARVGNPVAVAASSGPIARTVSTANVGADAIRATGQQNFQFRVTAHVNGSAAWVSEASEPVDVHVEQNAASFVCGLVVDTDTFVDIVSISADTGTSASDWITNQRTQTFSGTGEPGATVVLTAGGARLGTATVGSAGNWSIPNVQLTAGNVSYTATATDPVGNTATDAQSVHLDTVAPTVTQQAATCTTTGNPVSGVSGATWCRMTSRGWTMTASDETGGSGLATRQYTNAGSAWTAYTGSVSMAEANGRVMQARATDVAGNVSQVASGTYYIDGTPPTIAFDYPSSGLGIGQTLLIQLIGSNCAGNSVGCGTLTDSISGVGSATYRLNHSRLLGGPICFTGTGYSGTTCQELPVLIPTEGRWSAQGNASAAYPLSIYTFNFTVTSVDRAGNSIVHPTRTWTSIL